MGGGYLCFEYSVSTQLFTFKRENLSYELNGDYLVEMTLTDLVGSVYELKVTVTVKMKKP